MPTFNAPSLLGDVFIGEQHLTTTTTAARLTVPATAGTALIVVATGPVRFGFDPATLVTATTGISLPAGTILEDDSPRRISVVGAGTLDILYFD